MRHRRASASNGILDQRVRLSHQTFLLAAMAMIGLWMVGSLVQEVSLNQSLSRQSTDLRDRNAALRTTNDQYRKDIAAVSSGSAAEEEARMDGYARSDEKIYVITTPPPATPAPAAAKRRPAPTSSSGPFDALRHLLLG
jgi:cell division protein FtsB